MKTGRTCGREHATAKAFLVPVLLLILCGIARPQVQPSKGRDQPTFRVLVEVDLVVLQATVCDRLGNTVSGLVEQDFRVYEDGRLQTIRLFQHVDTPVIIGLVIDHSGSMREKLGDVASAARMFVRSSNPDDQMFVVNFNEKVSLGLPGAMRFSNSPDELGSAVWNAPAAGMTALYDAIVEALHGVQNGARDKKVLIVISDGGDNASRSGLGLVLKMAKQLNAMIYTIGVFDKGDADQNPAVLRRLARETGGEAFFPSEVTETVEICKRIAREVRDQYTIGFSSSVNLKPGTYHAIRLTAQSKKHGKLSVRTRTSYISGGESQQVEDVK